jgi:Putative Tad-like Flp pilus-assembly
VDARIAAADFAGGAARAGAQYTVADADGYVALDERSARKAAEEFAADSAYAAHVDTSPDAVTVTVTRTLDMTFLRLFGLGHKRVRATHTAAPVQGP